MHQSTQFHFTLCKNFCCLNTPMWGTAVAHSIACHTSNYNFHGGWSWNNFCGLPFPIPDFCSVYWAITPQIKHAKQSFVSLVSMSWVSTEEQSTFVAGLKNHVCSNRLAILSHLYVSQTCAMLCIYGVKVSYLTWVVDKSRKAYFQASPWQVFLPPQQPV